MVFLNSWILFALIPLFFIYKKRESTKQVKLIYASLFFMILAASQPALKNSFSDEKFHSQNYIIAIDASYSMQADDLKPTRYSMAKETIKKLLLTHPKDRFTLFAFTSNALLISPPTTDTAITIQALDALNPKYILTKSTNLHNLFTSIAKIPAKKKNLIIFSDGGDEHNVGSLVEILKRNNITPYIVATASQKGAALKKNGKYLKNYRSALVISKINPSLQEIAQRCDGYYYELTSAGILHQLSDDLVQEKSSKHEKIKVQSYKELYFIPLSLAILLYFLAFTKLHQLMLFIPLLLFSPHVTHADILDFYHIAEAKKDFNKHNFKKSALAFRKVTPSVQSYYNMATAYYKAKQYKNALKYYAQIKTANREVKQAIFYNMGNCYVRLKIYDKAKVSYINALALGEDKDTLYNLNLIRAYKTDKNIANLLPHKENSNKKTKSKSKNNKEKTKKKSSSSNSNANKSTNGAGNDKQKKKTTSTTKKKNNQVDNYKMGYKAYEIINKGYTHEKEPW